MADKTETGEGSRSAARLSAVQALYQIEFTDMAEIEVIRDFVQGRTGGVALCDSEDEETEIPVSLQEPDVALLQAVVKGVGARKGDIDPMIDGTLSSGWNADRLELIVRSILRAGVYELLEQGGTPARVLISEYVDIAVAFYQGPESKMINAVLDKLARVLRPHEFEG